MDVPLPWTEGFDNRVHGRAGDLMVVQVRSRINLKVDQKSALRSLGLRGPGSAALHFSYEPSIWGQIRKLENVVAVLELPSVYYKNEFSATTADSSIGVEALKYGTNSKPGRLWRDEVGLYFGFESERESSVAYWSSSSELTDVLDAAQEVGLAIDNGKEAYMLACGEGVGLVDQDGAWDDLYAANAGNRVVAVAIPTIEGPEITWRAPYKRFDDVSGMSAEVGCISAPTDILAIRALVKYTAHMEFIRTARPSVEVRTHGKPRVLSID
ncbi:uL30 family ribosomal protein [Pseudoclavibacter helvolus]|uniref:uL30 family ribosomal protein n=1 Tax=Pseudoclavibacter helvolus TaxID=255205 RepID=UPI0024ACC5A0|nr:uL30 family ribosomal protein [Pseudoclavibacter helvolus]